MVVFSAGSVGDRLFGQSNDLNLSTIQQMIKAGVAIYAAKSELRFNLFHLKKPILYFYDEVHVNGMFTWLDRNVDISLRFNDEALPDTLAKKYFQKGGCELTDHRGFQRVVLVTFQ